MNQATPSPQAQAFRKLVIYSLLGLVSLYGVAVAAGYVWLHKLRKNDLVTVWDVAFFRLSAIHRASAAQQFIKAQEQFEAKNYQAAFLYYSSGVRNDPDNIPGRLAAANFLRSVAAVNLAVIMLEEGLGRAPDDRRLIEAVFDLCTSTGRDRHALDLLHRQYGTGLAGPNRLLLQTYEVQATLAADGVGAAKKLLEQHPELLKNLPSTPVVARILWESAEKPQAIALLSHYLASQPQPFAVYAQLVRWQAANNQTFDAIHTAEQAIAKFPQDIAPRIILIELLSPQTPGLSHQWRPEIEAYLRDFAQRPEAVVMLAEMAGRKGWVDLARALYEVMANQSPNLSLLALYYGDALGQAKHVPEMQLLLAQIEAQAPEGNSAFLVQLRQRQIIAAAALGDQDNVREYARRLAATLRSDPDALEACRQLFQKIGIKDAVTEIAGRATAVKTALKQ